MGNIAYVNGAFVPMNEATISINDRGVQFGDAIYEVWGVKSRKLIDENGHFERLKKSLAALQIKDDFKPNVLKIIFQELLRRNRVNDGIIYLQISRGTAARDHSYPTGMIPNIIITARPKDFAALNKKAEKGISIKLTNDIRWRRVDIKTTNLLPNVIAKQEALDQGFDDVWFFDDSGMITEGSAQNAWIITKNNEIVTRNLSNNILPGITRAKVAELVTSSNYKLVERAFTIEELYDAKEAFVTSATSFVTGVVAVNGESIGNGKVGEIVKFLRQEYLSHV